MKKGRSRDATGTQNMKKGRKRDARKWACAPQKVLIRLGVRENRDARDAKLHILYPYLSSYGKKRRGREKGGRERERG